MTEPYQKRNIDPRKLKIPDVRITTEWSQDALKELTEDVKEKGIEDALKVSDDGVDLWVIDGKHRLEQALLLGLKTVPCHVWQMKRKGNLLRNLASNHLHGKTNASDEIRVIKELYENEHATIEEIQKEGGMTRERIENYILISHAHPEILQALDDGRIKFGHAIELIRLPDHASQSRVLSLSQQYNLNVQSLRSTVTDVIAIMKTQKEGQVPITPSPYPAVPTVPCGMCMTDHLPHELTSVILCRHCFASMTQARDQIIKALAESSKVDVKSSEVVQK